MEPDDRRQLYEALVPLSKRPYGETGATTLAEVSSVFTRLNANDKRFFIQEILDGAELGRAIFLESQTEKDLDNVISNILKKQKGAKK